MKILIALTKLPIKESSSRSEAERQISSAAGRELGAQLAEKVFQLTGGNAVIHRGEVDQIILHVRRQAGRAAGRYKCAPREYVA